jgi:tetratricopeptide (TPR) repeat protein
MLNQLSPLFQTNPWLQSIYWEKKALLDSMESRLPDVVEDLQKALKKGYPAAHLYDEEGLFLEWTGQREKAKVFFEQALRLPLNHTRAAQHLAELEGQKTPDIP